jgi:hypothetical protein
MVLTDWLGFSVREEKQPQIAQHSATALDDLIQELCQRHGGDGTFAIVKRFTQENSLPKRTVGLSVSYQNFVISGF